MDNIIQKINDAPKGYKIRYIKQNLPNNSKYVIRKFVDDFIEDVINKRILVNENRRKKVTFILKHPEMLFSNKKELQKKLKYASKVLTWRVFDEDRKEDKKRKRRENKQALINSKPKLIPFHAFLQKVNSVNLKTAKRYKLEKLLDTLKRYMDENKIIQEDKKLYTSYRIRLGRYIRIKNINKLNNYSENNVLNNNLSIQNSYTENNNKNFMKKIKTIS